MDWRPLSGNDLRALVVRRAALGRAFWLMPEADESAWQFGISPDAPVLRHPGGFLQEFLPSHHDLENAKAFSSLPIIRDFAVAPGLWSAVPFQDSMAEPLYPETWGMFEPLVRERLAAKENGEQLLAVLTRIKDSQVALRKAHPGYPPPVRGMVVSLK